MSITEQQKSLRFCLMLEHTSALARDWEDLKTNYVMPLLHGVARSYKQRAECALVIYRTRTGCNSEDMVQHVKWTTDFASLKAYVDGLQPSGGGQMEAAFAEGLAEAMYLFSRPSRYLYLKRVSSATCNTCTCNTCTCNSCTCNTCCITPNNTHNTYTQVGSPRIAQQALVFCGCQHSTSSANTMAIPSRVQVHTGMYIQCDTVVL